MEEQRVSLNFWKSRKQYPSYPGVLQRRLIDTNFVVSKVVGARSVLDIGCGDGSMLLSLREFTDIKLFYGYDVAQNLIKNLLIRWGDVYGLKTKIVNLVELEKLPRTDVSLALGLFGYIFDDGSLHNILENIKSNLLIVRTRCTLKKSDEVVNKFSEDLNAEYASIYRTVSNYLSILSRHFVISEINRAYPDEIESKYGTKQFFFVCERRGV